MISGTLLRVCNLLKILVIIVHIFGIAFGMWSIFTCFWSFEIQGLF